MLACDGYSGVIECMSELDLLEKATQLFKQFEPKSNTYFTKTLFLTEKQLAIKPLFNLKDRKN